MQSVLLRLSHQAPLANGLFLCFLGVLEEARFFGIEQLAEQLEAAIKVRGLEILVRRIPECSRLWVREWCLLPCRTPTNSELRCQVQEAE